MTEYQVKSREFNVGLANYLTVRQPIEVQEALPQPEDLDHLGRCWWFYVNDYGDSCWVLTDPYSMITGAATHWVAAIFITDPSGQ